jgi:aromatic ring-opening dioxygenase LigB subunit
MAEIVGGLATSHAPQLMLNPDQWGLLHTRSWEPLPVRPDLERETLDAKWAKWRQCHAAIARLRERLDALTPDTVVIVGDDQHENLLDDNLPPFTVFLGDTVEASTSLRYLDQPLAENRARYDVDAPLALGIVEALSERGFDAAHSRQTRYAGGLGHAFARPLKFLLPEPRYRIVPIMVNTYYPPAPSARRCVQFGQALASVLRDYDGARRVVVVASGGLSHTKIDVALDEAVLGALQRDDLEALARLEAAALAEGTSEIRNWLVVAGALDRPAEVLEYQPLYRAPTGIGCAMGFVAWK